MEKYTIFPDVTITESGIISEKFIGLGIVRFRDACRYVQRLPYGYNTTRDDRLIIFKENKGNCTTKHAVIASLAEELKIPIYKYIGIYAMNEQVVTGTKAILKKYNLPYIPMIHCFLVYENSKVDLTEGNKNGKNTSIEEFFFTQRVTPNISEVDEYMIYKKAMIEIILTRIEMTGISNTDILNARSEGLKLLRSKVQN
jgi:hypothetical protein